MALEERIAKFSLISAAPMPRSPYPPCLAPTTQQQHSDQPAPELEPYEEPDPHHYPPSDATTQPKPDQGAPCDSEPPKTPVTEGEGEAAAPQHVTCRGPERIAYLSPLCTSTPVQALKQQEQEPEQKPQQQEQEQEQQGQVKEPAADAHAPPHSPALTHGLLDGVDVSAPSAHSKDSSTSAAPKKPPGKKGTRAPKIPMATGTSVGRRRKAPSLPEVATHTLAQVRTHTLLNSHIVVIHTQTLFF